MPQKSVSCVICAYNEAPRIASVLKVVAGHPLLSEVIVVDDGSSDATVDVARGFPGVKVIALEKNGGKSRAFVRGVLEAKSDLILTLDADLEHLRAEDVTALTEPVLSGKADVTISLRGNTYRTYKFIGIDFVSGERVLPRSMITDHQKEVEALESYGLESFMNEQIIDQKLRLAIVPLDLVYNTRKRDKIGWWKGTLADLHMAMQVVRAASIFGVVRQNYMLLKLARLER